MIGLFCHIILLSISAVSQSLWMLHGQSVYTHTHTYTYTHTHTHTHTHTRTHARTHSRTHARAHYLRGTGARGIWRTDRSGNHELGFTNLILRDRSEEERLRQRRKQLDENLQDLIYDPASTLEQVDAEKIGLRRPVGKWWERSDRGFTEENWRNNLVVRLSAASSARRPWVHSKKGVCMVQVAQVSPELDRRDKQRTYQDVGRAQRRGESWCAAPLDKSLHMPGSGIKKQQRYSAAPAQDPMKMELGDEVCIHVNE